VTLTFRYSPQAHLAAKIHLWPRRSLPRSLLAGLFLGAGLALLDGALPATGLLLAGGAPVVLSFLVTTLSVVFPPARVRGMQMTVTFAPDHLIVARRGEPAGRRDWRFFRRVDETSARFFLVVAGWRADLLVIHKAVSLPSDEAVEAFRALVRGNQVPLERRSI
jgi:hypothetical protein